jgi:hypothetical protein
MGAVVRHRAPPMSSIVRTRIRTRDFTPQLVPSTGETPRTSRMAAVSAISRRDQGVNCKTDPLPGARPAGFGGRQA